MKTKPTRLVLCLKDMMEITGKGKTAVWRIRKAIKKETNKKGVSFITVKEFCEYTGIDEKRVLEVIQ